MRIRPDISGSDKLLRQARLIVIPLAALLFVGCGSIENAFGMQNGYLLHGQDAIALPGQPVTLRARLQSGDFLQDEFNRRVKFSIANQTIGETSTDANGFAEIGFTPDSPGDYQISVEVLPEGLPGAPPPPADLLVTCRNSDQPILVVDLDHTLVLQGFDRVLKGNPDPLPDSIEVMKRLAGDYTILYLTHRPTFLGPKSKRWLAEHGFPRGPVILSQPSELINGSKKYKTERLEALRDRFARLQIGIGDQPSDAQAYCQNKMTAYLILNADKMDDAIDIYKLGKDLRNINGTVQVVFSWREIEEGIFRNKKFTAADVIAKLKSKSAKSGRTGGTGSQTRPETSPATSANK